MERMDILSGWEREKVIIPQTNGYLVRKIWVKVFAGTKRRLSTTWVNPYEQSQALGIYTK